MAKGNAGGYVYTIKDPRLPADANVIFVGNSREPWIAVKRQLEEPSNAKIKKWIYDLGNEVNWKIEILGQVICDRYHGENVEIPPVPEGVTRIEWDILDVEDDEYCSAEPGMLSVRPPTKKNFWIQKLLDEGQPLLNGRLGRNPKPGKKTIPTVE